MIEVCHKLSFLKEVQLLGRIEATVIYLRHCEKQKDSEPTRAMRSILAEAEKEDAFGRVCALIGYITNDTCPIEQERLVYEMVTGEKYKEPDDIAVSTGPEME